MRAKEFLTEAYHSRIGTVNIGKWTVHIDSHVFVSSVARDIPFGVLTNIITSACLIAEQELDKVPRGTGTFIQDINTKISIYVRKSSSYPLSLTVETVLAPNMTPKEPLIKIDVPPSTIKELPHMSKANIQPLHKEIEKRGRDAVAQELDSLLAKKREQRRNEDEPELYSLPPMNREQRRAWAKKMRGK